MRHIESKSDFIKKVPEILLFPVKGEYISVISEWKFYSMNSIALYNSWNVDGMSIVYWGILKFFGEPLRDHGITKKHKTAIIYKS